MSEIAIVGGVYHERCIWPEWDHIYGSGGRAAAALRSHVERVTLHTYVREDVGVAFKPYASNYGFDVVTAETKDALSFEYVHCMSSPVIRPPLARIHRRPPIAVSAEAVLRFGMLEGCGKVDSEWCVYDPQSAFSPEPFEQNGSKAAHLAVVANRSEILAMTGGDEPTVAAQKLIEKGAEVVVVKSGPAGAYVITREGQSHIPAYRSNGVWTIGSGDVFAAIFAARWAVHRESPERAAELASRAVSSYAETMGLPSPLPDSLLQAQLVPASTVPGRVYLASPFFNLGQRWLVDEARRCLTELGLEVFSPVHDVGPGRAHDIGPADIDALKSCDRVFAILDGVDTGTVFEVGYASSLGVPVYALAQSVAEENLKMIVGTGSQVFTDFVTALHYTAWKA
ncbi:PfkB family carbohydrate kinase [Paraburkholderia sp. BCC1885]|uniref:PfkB family carbohydrate kinase n=1 Tax=Paraburkholderia sp. BCC1885 TaxID=2562669 RepID=UPI001182028D|nr:PfkB family carbohydrate kinase [Paraburkholderia sp. BCC1885]